MLISKIIDHVESLKVPFLELTALSEPHEPESIEQVFSPSIFFFLLFPDLIRLISPSPKKAVSEGPLKIDWRQN